MYVYCSNLPVVSYDPTGKKLKFTIIKMILGLIVRGISGLFNDKEYNNYYDPEVTDPTKSSKKTVEEIKEKDPRLENATVTSEYRGIIEYTATEKKVVSYAELAVWELMVFVLNFVPGLGVAAELGRGLTQDAVERNPGFYHCVEYTFTNEVIDYGSDGEIINSKKETWIYYAYYGVNDLTYYLELDSYSYIENYM